VRTGQNLTKLAIGQLYRRVLAMSTIVAVLFSLAALIGVALVALGWVPDTRQPGRLWYPTASDPDPGD
jgi:hypothetical protein